jgi:TonB family protein
MKRLTIIAVACLFSFLTMAQGNSIYDNLVSECDQLPAFPGGTEALNEFVNSSIEYPEFAIQNNIMGKLTVLIIIDENGKVYDPRIFKGLHPDLDREVVKALKKSPNWTPGMKKGKPIGAEYAIAISVSPQKNNTSTSKENSHKNQITVDIMPYFPGGQAALTEYIEKNMRYSADARRENIAGTVIVGFTIDSTGAVRNPSVLKGVHPVLDNEALRLVKEMPSWSPAKYKGKLVSVSYNVAVPFTLKIKPAIEED